MSAISGQEIGDTAKTAQRDRGCENTRLRHLNEVEGAARAAEVLELRPAERAVQRMALRQQRRWRRQDWSRNRRRGGAQSAIRWTTRWLIELSISEGPDSAQRTIS